MRNRRIGTIAFGCVAGWAFVCLAASPATQPVGTEEDGAVPVAVRWWGQACVSIETFWGFTIVIDPYPASDRMGYPKLDLSADLVLITHEHFDHTGLESIQGKPVVLHGLTQDGNWAEIDHYLDRPPNQPQVKLLARAQAATPSPHAVHVKGIRTFHDADSGAKRGRNTMFLIETDGLRILHCGDLGHLLTAEQVSAIGPIDLLLIPVGGTYTVDASGALAVVKQLKPRQWIWPIHFKTAASKSPLAALDAFLTPARQAGMNIREIKGNALAVTHRPAGRDTEAAKPKVVVSDFKPVRPSPAVVQALEAMRPERQALINALSKVSKTQLDHKPSDGTHTVRWNFEHTTGTEIGFFSQVYHALDPEIPLVNRRPAQMPPAFKPRHPEWDTAEMVRQVQRVAAFTERFSYLLADTPADMKVEGTRFSVQSLSDLMVGHYRNHTTKAVRKFELPDWPKE